MPNNREIATLIWLLALLALVLLKSDLRASLIELGRRAAAPILATLVAGVLYVAVIVWGGWAAGIWTSDLLTVTVVWFIAVAVALLFRLDRVWKQRTFLVGLLLKVVGLTALAEFAVNSFVLPLPAELVLVPVATLLGLVVVIAERSVEHAVVRGLAERMLAVIGVALVGYVVLKIIVDWNKLSLADGLRELALPVWLTTAFLPFVYAFALYCAYETAFMRLRFARELRRSPLRSRLALVAALHVRGEDLTRFAGAWASDVATAETFGSAYQSARAYAASQREKRRATAEGKRRLTRYAGVDGVDEDGRRLDRREFDETKGALRQLQTAQTGWYRNHGGKYRPELLEIFEPNFAACGLGDDHGVELRVSADGQAWWAGRRTITGWCLAIGAATPPPDEWLFDGPAPPTGFPGEDPAWGERFGLDAVDWH